MKSIETHNLISELVIEIKNLKNEVLELKKIVVEFRDKETLPGQLNHEYQLEKRITELLLSIGVPTHTRGYLFIREAIKMVYYEVDLLSKITKNIYPEIAKNYNTTPSRVERAIRHTIEVVWNRGNYKAITELFGSNDFRLMKRPVNAELIAIIADRLRLEFNNNLK